METYDIKRRNFFTIGPHTLGLIFIAVGVFVALSPLFITDNASSTKAVVVGSSAVLFGVLVVTTYKGTLFDFTGRRYKNYYAVAGYKIGQWESLPVLKAIRVFPFTYRAVRRPDGIHPGTAGEITAVKVALFGNEPKPVLVFESPRMDQAVKDAQVLAKQLGILLDLKLSDVNGTFELK